jgi:hypothetical protein
MSMVGVWLAVAVRCTPLNLQLFLALEPLHCTQLAGSFEGARGAGCTSV